MRYKTLSHEDAGVEPFDQLRIGRLGDQVNKRQFPHFSQYRIKLATANDVERHEDAPQAVSGSQLDLECASKVFKRN